MQPIKIEHNSADLERQLDFLIKREFITSYGKFRKPVYYFLGWIILLTLFSFLTGDNFVVLKGILLIVTGLAILAALIFLVSILIKFLNRKAWKRTALEDAAKSNKHYFLSFDEEGIGFSTDTYTSTMKWDYYKYYIEHRDSLFIFPDSIYHAMTCSISDLGTEEYQRLKVIISTKLEVLE